MTLPVTLTLTPEAEAKLRESLARKDGEAARQVLAEAVAPTVENLLSHPVVEAWEPKSPDELNGAESEAPADQLVTDISLSKSLFDEVETVAREAEGEADLPEQSVVVVSQVFTVDKSRLDEYIGTLSPKRGRQILDGLRWITEPREIK